MTREEFTNQKRHDYAGINDGSINPELKGHYWCLRLVRFKGTCLFHAEKLEDL